MLLSLLKRAGRTGPRAQLRVLQRWTGSPFTLLEPLVPARGTIVDAGCGFGLFSALLALSRPERTVIGIDLDAGKLERAHRLFGDIPNLRFQKSSLEEAAFPPCEGLVFYDVLHHLSTDKMRAALRRGRVALRGRLVIKENDITPAWKHRVSCLIEEMAIRGGITQSDPVEFRDPLAWKKELEAAGFVVERAEHLRAKAGFFVPHAVIVGR